MIPDGNIPNPVKSIIYDAVFGVSLIGKMVIVEVTMKDPPAVFVTVLVFRPSPELPPDECFQPVENTLRANGFVIVRPSPDDGV
jgi:hypothetical protein